MINIRTTISITDGQRCINCHEPARQGKISHRNTCPEWTERKTAR